MLHVDCGHIPTTGPSPSIKSPMDCGIVVLTLKGGKKKEYLFNQVWLRLGLS